MKKFFIISAIASEQSCFEKKIFRLQEKHIQIFPAGVGLVESALNLGKLIGKSKPSRLFFVGTCGASRASGLTIGSVVIPEIVKLIDIDAIGPQRGSGKSGPSGEAYFPGIMKNEFHLEVPHANILKQNFPYPVHLGKTCSNPLAITGSLRRAKLLSRHGMDIENLELAALGQLGHLLQTPVTAVLGVSNFLGPDAHQEWRENRQMAEKHSCLLLKQIIHSIKA